MIVSRHKPQTRCARVLPVPGLARRAAALLGALVVVAGSGVAHTAEAARQVQGGIHFVAVSDEAPGTELVLMSPLGEEVGRGTTDSLGSLIFRELAPGAGYAVQDTTGGAPTPVEVRAFTDLPDPSFYTGQTLVGGFQYIRMRDGTLLSAMVRPPLGKSMADGPFPTLVEYSGYSASNPGATEASSLIAGFLGYATVGVNMRGSGCSGGVLDLFDLPTTADGYDVIETVAAQSWVAGGKVGMIGISFPGISQLFVGGARPPHLAALAPLSTIADIYRAPGFPGGIFNTGFAQSWLQDRKNDAAPAPSGGQGWARQRVRNGDTVCRDNQKLRLQTQDPIEFTRTHDYYESSLMDARSPIQWVSQIDVPVFYAAAFQDEQTGGDFASMLHRFPRRPNVKITTTNGVHSSTLDPAILHEWIAFLDIYVAGRLPDPSRVDLIASIIYGQILGSGSPVPPMPVDRYEGVTTLAEGRRRFEAAPPVRVLMENGAGTAIPGLPGATFELGFERWPPPRVRAMRWYFGSGGTLSRKRPAAGDNGPSGGFDEYRPDPTARPMQTLPGQGQSESWQVIPPYDWRPLVDGTALAWATPALDRDLTVVGPGSVDLWLRSSAPDTDLQVTLSEIRPDGKEAYVQTGWLRASHRQLDRKTSSRLDPRPTHLELDASDLPPDEWSAVRVAIFAMSHVFRAGSRIRISVEAPGGDRTRWNFATYETDGLVVNQIARMATHPSRLVLPVVPGVEPPSSLPPCPGLRGQPCRSYVAASNGG